MCYWRAPERERERERVAKLLEWPNFVQAECHWQVLNLPKWLRRRQNSPKANKSAILFAPLTIFDLRSKQLTLGRAQTRLALLSLNRCFNSRLIRNSLKFRCKDTKLSANNLLSPRKINKSSRKRRRERLFPHFAAGVKSFFLMRCFKIL